MLCLLCNRWKHYWQHNEQLFLCMFCDFFPFECCCFRAGTINLLTGLNNASSSEASHKVQSLLCVCLYIYCTMLHICVCETSICTNGVLHLSFVWTQSLKMTKIKSLSPYWLKYGLIYVLICFYSVNSLTHAVVSLLLWGSITPCCAQ